ncbi:hypothetical protein M885DRAFT_616133 [Pelagophyceae sp. CCMP2097]|nr:hypothetical protein M885DRAFT_616133 [Pelagophyceae sp. CCMP2097]
MSGLRSCPVRQQSKRIGSTAKAPLNVVVPMGGLSSNEYTEQGYRVPKPMVPIVGRPMVFWLFDNLELEAEDHIWIGLHREVATKFSIEQVLRREYPHLNLHFVCFDFETRGVTETLYCILNAMDAESRARRTISLDSDTLWFCDVLGGARALPADVGASFYFNDTSVDATAPYSYIRVDSVTSEIVDIREKVAISHLANNGAYVFVSGDAARDGLEGLLDEACGAAMHPASPPAARRGNEERGAAEAWRDADDEAVSQAGSEAALVPHLERGKYVSGLIAHMMAAPRCGKFLAVQANDFANLGTPARLRAFIDRIKRGEVRGARAMRFCFGLDGTLLALPPGADATPEVAVPIEKNIALARELHANGHTIIIWTDRGSAKNSAGRALADVGRLTFEQLERFQVPYDEIVFGQPAADVYVDARACNALVDLEKALGWDAQHATAHANTDLAGGVAPRHFNSVRRVGDTHVEKTGPRAVLRGEAFWYQHVPPQLAELFPHAVAVREHPAQELSSILLTRINGVTFSHLAVNACLTTGRLRLLLSGLKRLHACPAAADAAANDGDAGGISNALLCSNYHKKVASRYAQHEAFFKSFAGEDAPQLAAAILPLLADYESSGRFVRAAYIHGDPVFSNVLLTSDATLKFLDMRGALGDQLTTAGDVAYDLSKVYQSLCGYDSIILDIPPSPGADDALRRLRELFAEWLAEAYADVSLRDVRALAAAHFFCIVPLHDNRAHQQQFLKAARKLLQEDGLL